MSYFEKIFLDNIIKNDVKIIFELGSRDLIDAIKLQKYYGAKVYAFECNPDCLLECKKNLLNAMVIKPKIKPTDIFLVENAVSITDDIVSFYPFDLSKYNNMGSSSMFKIDFSKRDEYDPDYNRPNPQKEITVQGIRLDTFIKINNINAVDMLCIDLQGYELNAIKSLGSYLNFVKYIIVECSIENTYIGGSTFMELYDYLAQYNFKYMSSTEYNYDLPNVHNKGFTEFDVLFVRKDVK